MLKDAARLDTLIRARYPIIYLVTWEEERARQILADIAQRHKRLLTEWTFTGGLHKFDEPRDNTGIALAGEDESTTDPLAALEAVALDAAEGVFFMKDLHRFFAAQTSYASREKLVRKLRDLYPELKRAGKTIIICAPVLELPTELEKAIYIVNLAPPGKDELMDLLKSIARKAHDTGRWRVDLSVRDAENFVDAVLGLTLEEAERVFVKALVTDGALTARDLGAVREEKEQIVRKSGLLEYCHVEDAISDVGGLAGLKRWLNRRGKAFGEKARAFGLPAPKGILLLGVQGCGKSLCAKAVSSLWRFPLLRLDMSRIFSGYIGASEENIRKALHIAESISPALLWIDEIEKAFSGLENSGRSDAGATSRVFGTFLTWQQENRSEVFVVATANAIESLPPELMRKGRFDEIFFLDLPREEERREIAAIHLRKRKRDPAAFNVDELARACEGFSGAEIEQAILDAMYGAFDKDRDLRQEDILESFGETVPLSVTRREAIDALRQWAHDRTRPTA